MIWLLFSLLRCCLGNFTIGFTTADVEVIESAGSVDICIRSSINNFRNGIVTLKVVIPMIHENGKIKWS